MVERRYEIFYCIVGPRYLDSTVSLFLCTLQLLLSDACFRARLAGLRAAPAPLTSLLFISCSNTVHRSCFSLFSFPLSLTAPEPEKLVFWLLRLQLLCATVWELEPAGARPNTPFMCSAGGNFSGPSMGSVYLGCT